jgi:uncharacterized SAM-binding protein YcdF (DUF218 family)
MIYLHRALPIVVLPFGFSLIVMLAGLLLRRRALIWTGIAVLWISGTPVVSERLMRAAEGWAERTAAADSPTVDAIVVLSGGRAVAPGRAGISEWGDANRFFGGVELFQAGKAPLLVFTGGWVPWQPNAALEGQVLAGYARAQGVPADQIITTGPVSVTADEARAVAALLRKRQTATPRVLLVTSAFHMPRAQRLFERAGLTVTPFPVGFQVSPDRRFTVLDLLPTISALGATQTAIREMYGRLFYRVMSF